MQHLNYVLFDLGIISRCSAGTAMPCNKIWTVCSSTRSFMSSDTTRTMPLCSPLKYLHRKHFLVVYPFGRATKISFPLVVSEKTCTRFSFKSSYFLPLLTNDSPLIHCTMLSTSLSISHLIIKWVLRAASHDWILSSDWATVSSVAGQQLYTQLTRPFPLHVEVHWLCGTKSDCNFS